MVNMNGLSICTSYLEEGSAAMKKGFLAFLFTDPSVVQSAWP